LPHYTQRGIALYTIAFTEGADRPLLQAMAQATGGEYRFIPNALGLHEAFQDLFQIARQAEALPLTDQAFFLDASIRDASLVVSKTPGQEPVRLLTPHHERIQADSPHAGITWTSTPAYEGPAGACARWSLYRSDRSVPLSRVATSPLPEMEIHVTSQQPMAGSLAAVPLRSMRIVDTGTLRRFAGSPSLVPGEQRASAGIACGMTCSPIRPRNRRVWLTARSYRTTISTHARQWACT